MATPASTSQRFARCAWFALNYHKILFFKQNLTALCANGLLQRESVPSRIHTLTGQFAQTFVALRKFNLLRFMKGGSERIIRINPQALALMTNPTPNEATNTSPSPVLWSALCLVVLLVSAVFGLISVVASIIALALFFGALRKGDIESADKHGIAEYNATRFGGVLVGAYAAVMIAWALASQQLSI